MAKTVKTVHTGRIEAKFNELKSKGEKALITFVTAGDPDLAATKDIIFTLERSGADIIELGVPFSDPMADGPTIQAAYERALKHDVHLTDVLGLVKEVREKSAIPIVLFGYYNPVYQFGLGKFAKEAKKAGVDGVLIVDLPAEEADELKSELDKAGIDFIFLLTPTSTEERIKLITSKASGFLYFVSVTGVTGARTAVSRKVPGFVKKVKRHTKLPVGVGFGISNPDQVREICANADGAVVGSAIINIIAKAGKTDILKEAGTFVSGLKSGTRD